MRVQELWRYPVKSLQGERLHEANMTADGVEGDRRFALFDLATGLGLTARRVPQLLFASAALMADAHVRITLLDGSIADTDAALSDWLGRRVALRSAVNNAGRRYENVVDFEHEQTSSWETFDGAPGPFHDSDWARVSLLSTTSIGVWNSRRFHPNVLFDGAPEDSLVGSTVTIGEAILKICRTIQRCVMVTRPQPDGIDRGPERPTRDRTRTHRPSRGRRARHPPRHHPHRRRATPPVDAAACPASYRRPIENPAITVPRASLPASAPARDRARLAGCHARPRIDRVAAVQGGQQTPRGHRIR